MLKVKNQKFISIYILILSVFILIIGCEEKPSDLGANFIPPSDTAGTKILDTVIIAGTNLKYPVNMYGSENLYTGAYQTYEAKGLLMFRDIPSEFAGSTINSASLKLKYHNTFYKDSSGIVSVNIVKINRSLNFTKITTDSVSSSDFGTIPYGTYSGNPTDTNTVNIPVSQQLIKDWLEYAADTNYSVKNYGIAFTNTGSVTIKGFYSSFSDFRPEITVSLNKNGRDTTFTLSSSISTSLINAVTLFPSDRIFVQGGVSFRSLMNFNISNLPRNVIINEAALELTLDRPSSFIRTDATLRLNMVKDSATGSLDQRNFTLESNGDLYKTSVNYAVQKWSTDSASNKGLVLRASSEIEERYRLNTYVFYSSSSPDISKRPRLRIRYTLRQ
jgi:hypothetical protein